jgi:hypothetical protein
MTEPIKRAPVVQAQPGTRLEQLAAQYDLAKAEADKAGETLKAVVDAIKLELTLAAPNETTVDLYSPDLARPLRLIAVDSWRVDAKKLKTEAPETYVRYAKRSTSWQLRPIGVTP